MPACVGRDAYKSSPNDKRLEDAASHQAQWEKCGCMSALEASEGGAWYSSKQDKLFPFIRLSDVTYRMSDHPQSASVAQQSHASSGVASCLV
eukprot:2189490-Amphidinium_carterae.1